MNFRQKRTAAGFVAALFLLSAVSCREKPGDSVSSSPASSETGSAASVDDRIPSYIDDEIDSVYNLALQGQAVADSVSSDYPTYDASCLNDGNLLSRWLSEKAGTEEEPSTFGIDWEEEKTFDILVIYWEAAHPAEDGYAVLTDFPEAEEELSRESGEETKPYRIVRRNTESDDGQVDIVLFNEPVTASWLRLQCTEGYYSESNHLTKNHPSCYELEVYYSEDLEADDQTLSELPSETETVEESVTEP